MTKIKTNLKKIFVRCEKKPDRFLHKYSDALNNLECNYLARASLRWCSVIDGTDGDIINTLRFTIQWQRRFDGACVGVDLESIGCVTAKDRVGEFVVRRTDVFVDGNHRHYARPGRRRLSNVGLVDRLDENGRIVAVLDGYYHLKVKKKK